ncbi:hypothetical protein DPV78_003594 [Talaromyces pinophilus]|nr:hypothetical protein DPV78_003594 [Talaromyces pinophilus]
MSSVALVGNIVQFIELAAHVFNNFYQAYRSGYAISLEVIEKKKLIELVLTDMIEIPPLDSSAYSATMNDIESLRCLVEQYMQIAEKLLFIMDEIKVKNKPNIWVNMISATKGLRRRKTIEQLLEKLELLGSAIIL